MTKFVLNYKKIIQIFDFRGKMLRIPAGFIFFKYEMPVYVDKRIIYSKFALDSMNI
jgi:hypothetical protein